LDVRTRIGTIKKGFFEFQFTREVIDPSSTPATYYVAGVENTDGGAQQNSPKRKRTGREDERNSADDNVTGNASNIRGGGSQTNQQRASDT
jgi:hypothetical protein